MRKITKESVKAFLNGYNFNKDNTAVICSEITDDRELKLHGNTIARYTANGITISNAGWPTPTTKERLNGLLHTLGKTGIHQKNFVWYWVDGKVFNDDEFYYV